MNLKKNERTAVSPRQFLSAIDKIEVLSKKYIRPKWLFSAYVIIFNLGNYIFKGHKLVIPITNKP